MNDFEYARRLFKSSNALPVLTVSALAPACLETMRNYPSVALVAPLEDSTNVPLKTPQEARVPFPVPPRYGVHAVRDEPPEADKERLIFNQADESKLAWFLPNGCFFPEDGGLNCFNSKSITATVVKPNVPYYIVVWDPKGMPQDYTLNVGFDESFFTRYSRLERSLWNFNALHLPCTEPYEGSWDNIFKPRSIRDDV